MKQDNRNRVSVIQRNLDDALRVNPIEDGNMPIDDPKQGYVYTSEIDNSDYAFAYKGVVNSIFSSKTRTGDNNFYQLEVSYIGIDESLSTSAWFGNNLIKAGDPFVLQPLDGDWITPNFNYVKGSVINVINITQDNSALPNVTYKYTIICSIAEGLSESMPQGLNPHIQFLTNRRVFSTNNSTAPINLLSAINKSTNKVNLYWDDTTNKAISYRLNIRSANNEYLFTYDVNGTSPNFNGVLKPYVRSQQLKSVKIINQGTNWSLNQLQVGSLLDSNAVVPAVFLNNDGHGKARISKWQVINRVSHAGPISIILQMKPLDSSLLSVKGFVDMNDGTDNLSYVDSWITSGTFITIVIAYPDGNPYSSLSVAEFDELFFNKVIDIHTGVSISSMGGNINKDPIFTYDKYPDNTKWILPINFPFGTGTSWYWSVAAIHDNDKKIFSEWSQEELLILN